MWGGLVRPWLHKRKPLTCSLSAQETAEKLPLTDLPASEYLLLSTPVPILEASSHFSPDHYVRQFNVCHNGYTLTERVFSAKTF